MLKQTMKLVLLPAAAAVLVACGGGGGGGTNSSGISGVAATGAPIANAPVFVKDSTGAEPTGQSLATGVALVTTDANGAYAIPSSLLSGLKGPFIVRVAGTKVLDSGDDATAVLHAVVPNASGASANLTPLTEAATILTLGTDTASAFQSPQNSVANYTAAAAQSANTALLSALSLPAGLGNINLVSGSLDAIPTTNLNNPSTAKLHDMLLDTFEFSTSQGKLVLSDRNRSENQSVSGPQVVISAPTSSAAATVSNTGGAMEGVNTAGLLDSTELQSFITRFNARLSSGCSVPLLGNYSSTCDNVLNPANGVFSAAYKHTGMTSDKWLSAWVATPLDVEDLSDVKVSVRAAYRGTFMATPSQRVTRVALKFERPNGDYVIRTMLLADEGANVTVYGNQSDFFLMARPRLTVNTDADDTYPYNPKYEVGMQFIVKHWYAGRPDMILGAHIDGPGLPAANSRNYNGRTSGIEIFRRTDAAAGCSNMAIDPKVYEEKNSRTWDAAWAAYKLSRYNRAVLYDGQVRWREGNLTCNPMFDMRRYYTSSELASLVLPKRDDVYNVTLYLDANQWGGPGQPALPPGAGALVTNKRNADGDTISYYPLAVVEKLRSDAFSVPTGNTGISASLLPGVTDATRARLLTYAQGSDRLVEWTRNLIKWPELDTAGGETFTTFGNFVAGVFTSAKDQLSAADNGYSSLFNTQTPPTWSDPNVRGFKDYREFFTTAATPPGHLTITAGVSAGRLDLDCGATATYKGSTVRVRVRKVTNLRTGNSNDRIYEEVSCAAANAVTNGNLMAVNATTTSTLWNWVGTGNNAFYRNGTGSTETIRYQFDVVRDRTSFQSDKSTLVMGNQLSRTLTWAQMMAKEKVGSQALCSAHEGAWAYRKAYVILADMNGRQIQEGREVSADFPGLTSSTLSDGSLALATRYTSAIDLGFAVADGGTANYAPALTRAIDISRPNYLTDSVYLPLMLDASGYDLSWTVGANTSYAWLPITGSNWHAQPGVIQPAYEKASANATTCTRVSY